MILYAVMSLAGIGLFLGLGLVLASRYLAVEVDPRIENVQDELPGANCGACGYPGCSGFAAAVVGGVAQVTRGIFARNQDVTLNAREPRSSLTATDVVVEDTGPRQSDGASGMGVGIYDGGASNLRRFRVEDTPLCGVHVATGELGDGELDLEDGLVVRAAIGACVQVEGYDLDRLQRNVRYIDNGTSLQATMLPVPEAAAPIFGP